MERKIGEVLIYEGKTLKVVGVGKLDSCNGCYFDRCYFNNDELGCTHNYFVDNIQTCYWEEREDKTNVIFKEVK